MRSVLILRGGDRPGDGKDHIIGFGYHSKSDRDPFGGYLLSWHWRYCLLAVRYCGKISFDDKKAQISIRWLGVVLCVPILITEKDLQWKVRVFGVPILRSDAHIKNAVLKSLLPQKHRNEKLRRQPKQFKKHRNPRNRRRKRSL